MTAIILAFSLMVPYLEGLHLFDQPDLQRGDIQRQIVMFRTQARLTPRWPDTYRQLMKIHLDLGQIDQARAVSRSFLAQTGRHAFGQLQLLEIELHQYQTVETRRQFLEELLNDETLLPEVISDIYRRLGEIAYENYESERAEKYLEFALKRVPQNLRAHQMMRTMIDDDRSARPVDHLAAFVAETQAMLMTNPFDAISALELAIAAGQSGLSDQIDIWLDHADRTRSLFDPQTVWPTHLQLELAESYLAVDRPELALNILMPMISAQPKNQPDSLTFDEIRTRMLIMLSAAKSDDRELLAEQQQWLSNVTRVVRNETPDTPDIINLLSLFYSVYGEPAGAGNTVFAVALALQSYQAFPENRNSRIALILALARSGEIEQSVRFLKELNEPFNPLLMIAQVLIERAREDREAARKLLSHALAHTPYGPLRNGMLVIAEQIELPDPLPPNLSQVQTHFKQFDTRFLKDPSAYRDLATLDIDIKGQADQGDIVEIELQLTNVSDIPLSIGPGSFLGPLCLIEIQNAPGQPPLLIEIPVDSRQILSPGQSLTLRALLDQATSEDRSRRWDDLVADPERDNDEATIQAIIRTSAILTQPVAIVPVQTEPRTVELPTITTESAVELIERMRQPVTDNPWQTARLARWHLMNPTLVDLRQNLIAAMRRQLDVPSNQTQSAFAWAIRAAPPEPETLNALAKRLNSEDWIVRLMTLDTIGQIQGTEAEKIFQFYAAKDSDELVRQLSTGYLLYRN